MNEIIGAGSGILPAPIPPEVIHDEQYGIEVYPAYYGIGPPPQLDLFVSSYGNFRRTLECIESVYNFTTTPFHLILLLATKPDDYGLPEIWAKRMNKERANFTVCLHRGNWESGNRFFNVGLKYARTEYVTTIMNSITVEPGWELTGLQLMKNDPLIGTIGFKCLFPNGSIESAGIVFVGHIPTDYGRGEPGYRCNEVREMQAVQWAFALHRKKALEGNLDDTIWEPHVGWDDIDNCFVLKSKGWKIMYCGQGAGIHTPRASRGSDSTEAAVKNQKNARTFFKRWGLWKNYLEGTKMDVGATLKYETKAKLSEAITKIQVLQSFVAQSEQQIGVLVNEAMKELGVDGRKYLLEMNPQANTWLLKANAEAHVVENAKQVEAIKPAGDTETAPTPEVTNAAVPV